MKKLFLLLLVIVLFSSCELSLTLKDEEGWELYQLGWSLNPEDYMIQSHDGYLLTYQYDASVDDDIDAVHVEIVENEFILSGNSYTDIIVKNPSTRTIKVKVTHNFAYAWHTLMPGESLAL